MGYSPWGHKELEMTESLIHTRCVRNGSDVFSFIHSSHSVIYSFIGEKRKLVISILLKNFWGGHTAQHWYLTSPKGWNLHPPAVEAWSPNHWTTGKVLVLILLDSTFQTFVFSLRTPN